jgi:hypothetical protein
MFCGRLKADPPPLPRGGSMSWNPYRFTSDEDLIKSHHRAVLDFHWLEQMFQECAQGNPAKEHYRSRIIKERELLEALTDEMDRRNL